MNKLKYGKYQRWIEEGNKIIDHECRLREISNSTKHNNICIISIPEEEEREKKTDLFQEIIAEKFSNLGKVTDIQIHGAKKTPIKTKKSRPTLRNTTIKFAIYKDKEIIQKAMRQKKSLPYKGRQMRLAEYLSTRLAGQKGGAWAKLGEGECSQECPLQQRNHLNRRRDKEGHLGGSASQVFDSSY